MRLPELPETRLEFFLPRLLLSLLLFTAFWTFVRYLWYPGHFYELSGSPWLMVIVAAFVLLVGPALTTLVYRRDKKGMWADIAVLAVVEMVAIAVATNAFYDRRPAFLVLSLIHI